MAIVQTMAKQDLQPFCTHDFDSAVFQLMSQDTSRSVRTSHASGLRSIQTEILNFPVDHILQVSCDWILCCNWYALHGVGRQVALWPNPRPFPRCGIGSGHARLVVKMLGISSKPLIIHWSGVSSSSNCKNSTLVQTWDYLVICGLAPPSLHLSDVIMLWCSP